MPKPKIKSKVVEINEYTPALVTNEVEADRLKWVEWLKPKPKPVVLQKQVVDLQEIYNGMKIIRH